MTRRQIATRGEVTACRSGLIDQAAIDPVALASASDRQLGLPGKYALWVNDTGARQLSAGLGHPIAVGLVYSGQAGATKWPSGKRGSATLRSRLVSQHWNGRIRGSTFRLTLAAILADQLGLEHVGPKKLASESESELSAWVRDHLSVSYHGFEHRDGLASLEDQVLAELDPPLNLAGRPPSLCRTTLTRSRAFLAGGDSAGSMASTQVPRNRIHRSRLTSQPTLHEELLSILRESGREWMATSELASEVNRRGNYNKRDGSAVTDFQIHGRTRNYPHLFKRDGSSVGLA